MLRTPHMRPQPWNQSAILLTVMVLVVLILVLCLLPVPAN